MIILILEKLQKVYELISPDIKPHGPDGAFGIPCSQIDSIRANISFTFMDVNGHPFNLIVPSQELSVGPFNDDPETCQTLINALDTGGVNIIGGSLLKHYCKFTQYPESLTMFEIFAFAYRQCF